MKKTIFTLLCLPVTLLSQTTWFDSGSDLSYLKKEKKISYEIRWDSATFNGNETEKAYCAAKVNEKNAVKPGDGDVWLEKWEHSKANVFVKYFTEFFVPRMKKAGLAVKNNDVEMNYHIIIYVLDIDPGKATIIAFSQNVAASNSAKVNFRALIVDNKDRSKVLSNIYSERIPGMEGIKKYDYDKSNTGRIKYSFLGYGYYLADEVLIKLKKQNN